MRLFCFKRPEAKCPGCGWRTNKLYVLADSSEEARAVMHEEGGLCGECMAELLSEQPYVIIRIFTIDRDKLDNVGKQMVETVRSLIECWTESIKRTAKIVRKEVIKDERNSTQKL